MLEEIRPSKPEGFKVFGEIPILNSLGVSERIVDGWNSPELKRGFDAICEHIKRVGGTLNLKPDDPLLMTVADRLGQIVNGGQEAFQGMYHGDKSPSIIGRMQAPFRDTAGAVACNFVINELQNAWYNYGTKNNPYVFEQHNFTGLRNAQDRFFGVSGRSPVLRYRITNGDEHGIEYKVLSEIPKVKSSPQPNWMGRPVDGRGYNG